MLRNLGLQRFQAYVCMLGRTLRARTVYGRNKHASCRLFKRINDISRTPNFSLAPPVTDAHIVAAT